MNRMLQLCAEIEETIARIYRKLAVSVVCEPQLTRVWQELASDEDQHALQLRFAQRLAKEDILGDQKLPPGKIEQLHARVQSVLAGVEKATPSKRDALRVSVKLEQDCLAVHIGRCAEVNDPGAEKILRALSREDAQHVEVLRAYLASQGLVGPAPSASQE